jgi:hypothetical protein
MTDSNKSNRLIHASSPYLLQHAHNPVDWHEWNQEALDKAVNEDKPILVSIGYSACHWCHVMEKESFEDPDIAALMNAYFICIKVDREERPDVDHIYMDAVHAMGMQGGWPLNVFLTPQQVPFYGGTYFPKSRFARILIDLNKAYQERRAEIETSAADLLHYLNQIAGISESSSLQWSDKLPDEIFKGLADSFDDQFGGLKRAPKFVMPSIWQFLLRYAVINKHDGAIKMVESTLTKIALGGIYDQLAGGFARYSVDERWFAPHFEKMLYDNAQLLTLYAEAYTQTHNELFRLVLIQTAGWLKNEMQHPEGGFYSALDADSEGEEGRFYCWTDVELRDALGPDYALGVEYFSCSQNGNWEHGKNILLGRNTSERPAAIDQISGRLLTQRNKRVRPGTDDKIITSWNAMLIKGLIDAGLAIHDDSLIDSARAIYQFIQKHLTRDGKLLRSFRNKATTTEGFLDDYAFMIQACISLYEATFDEAYLKEACRLTEYTLDSFYDAADGYFFYTAEGSAQLISRKKELHDNVIPSSNGLMASMLLRLSCYYDRNEWRSIAEAMILKQADIMRRSSAYMCGWSMALQELIHGYDEVAITGNHPEKIRKEFAREFFPFILFAGTDSSSDLPLLKGKSLQAETPVIFVCRNYACQEPVTTVEQAIKQLRAK